MAPAQQISPYIDTWTIEELGKAIGGANGKLDLTLPTTNQSTPVDNTSPGPPASVSKLLVPSNWASWSVEVQDKLKEVRMWKYVDPDNGGDGNRKALEAKTPQLFQLKLRQAFDYLRNSCGVEAEKLIKDASTPVRAWLILEEEYGGNIRIQSRVEALLGRLLSTKVDENKDIVSQIQDLQSILKEVCALSKIDEANPLMVGLDRVLLKKRLHLQNDAVSVFLTKRSDLTLKSALLGYELHQWLVPTARSPPRAPVSPARSSSSKPGYPKRLFKGAYKGRKPGDVYEQKLYYENDICFNCHHQGHTVKQCPVETAISKQVKPSLSSRFVREADSIRSQSTSMSQPDGFAHETRSLTDEPYPGYIRFEDYPAATEAELSVPTSSDFEQTLSSTQDGLQAEIQGQIEAGTGSLDMEVE
jgi:hypothetical protein